MKFILSFILLIVGIFFTQPAFAVPVQEALKLPDVSVITAPNVMFEMEYSVSPIHMVASAVMPGHLNVIDTFNISDLTGKDLITVAKFKEVETVPKFPYLIHVNHNKLYR